MNDNGKPKKFNGHLTPTVPHLIPATNLTGEQIDRQDEVDNAIYNLVNALIPPQYAEPTAAGENQIEWDIEFISDLRSEFEKIIWEKLNPAEGVSEEEYNIRGEQFEMNFYPFLKNEDETEEIIPNFDGDKQRFNSDETNRRTYNQSAYDDGFKARLDEHDIATCPSVEQSSVFYAVSWKYGWIDADADILLGKVAEFEKALTES